MSIISNYHKIKKYSKTADGYQLLSHWTSSDTVEMNDGTTLEHRISNVDNTSDQDKPVSAAQQIALKQKADIANPALTGTPTAPTPASGSNTNQIATTAFVQSTVNNAITASDAMIIKGTIGTTGTVTILPTTYQTGWTYRVVTDGTYAGHICEVGDLIIALIDRDGTDRLDSDWCVAQTNINGAITGVKNGDAYINSSQSGSIVTISHQDVPRTNETSTAKPPAGGTFTAVKSINSDTKGHVTGVETETITLPVLDATGLGLVSTGSSQKLTDTEKKNARDNIGAAPVSHASSATTYGISTTASYGHAMATSTVPKANGTATAGSETAKFARGDHVHPLQTSVTGSSGSCTGNAATATKLATARTFTLYDADSVNSSSVSFNGSSNVSLKIPAIINGTLVRNWLYSLYGSTGGMLGAEYANYIRLWTNYYRTNVPASGDNACWGGSPDAPNTSGLLFVAYAVTGNAYFQPHIDNDVTLGASNKRYKQIYATTSTISTSDRNKKHDISYIGTKSNYETTMTDEQLEKFVMGLLPSIYRLNDGDSGRPHHGLIAQDVEALMQKIGLSDHAGFIRSPKTREIEVEKKIEEEIVDPDTGKINKEKKIVKESQLEEIPGEYIYSLRYEEFIADVIRFVQIQKIRVDGLEERLTVSEKKNVDLEKRIEVLEKLLINQ